MNYLMKLSEITPADRAYVGGKGHALARLAEQGLRLPATVCLTTGAYNDYLDQTGLRERILMELNRKDFQEMRWEEMWDAALRIRNFFLTTPMPEPMAAVLEDYFRHWGTEAVVVRSSAPDEDAAGSSFAGLHESFVNVTGAEAILHHIRLVWASLWSDAALLYRQELGLNIHTSSMAVVIQELIAGEVSGVAFSRNPMNEAQTVIEAVYGLNQGLVDGLIEPDRWLIDRPVGALVHTAPSERASYYLPEGDSISRQTLPAGLADKPPLSPDQVRQVYEMALQLENIFASPQDVEWTKAGGLLYLLQSRPITTVATDKQDQRPWYLSLKRSYENLQELRRRLEHELLPAMTAAAAALQQQDLGGLHDADLAQEIQRRQEISDHWVAVYWRDFIPFAHGMRLFGQLYNDTVRPEDPFEFMSLLGGSPLASLDRNRCLAELADRVRQDARLALVIGRKDFSALPPEFRRLLDEFMKLYGNLSCPVTGAQCQQGPEAILQIVMKMAEHPPRPVAAPAGNVASLTENFLNRFFGARRQEAASILDLARASYRLRDDDNVYLGRIEAEKIKALREARQRLAGRNLKLPEETPAPEIIRALIDPNYTPQPLNQAAAPEQGRIEARQLIGQPAGPGLARGQARVIHAFQDLAHFGHGEILVCDAVDPTMTFVVPLAAAVVERRGGMLIHGAIIAREYGLPCVTGVPEATRMIHTGDTLTVDGYLGIVVIN